MPAIMCIYCERRKDIKIGWDQPCLYDKNWQHPTNTIKNTLSSNLNINGQPDWEARIYDYQTSTPELILTSKNMAKVLWGSGTASIYIPIKRCPVCGRPLGKQIENNNTQSSEQSAIKSDIDLVIQFSMLWGMTIGSAFTVKETQQASEMKQYDSLELNRIFTAWSVEFKNQTILDDSCDFFRNKLKELLKNKGE